jgi:ATP-binding cassette, subfamily B, bacterial PglK
VHELRIFLSIGSDRSKRALLALLPLAAVVAALEIAIIALVLPLLALMGSRQAWNNLVARWPWLGPDVPSERAVMLFVGLLVAAYLVKAALQVSYYRLQTKLVARSQAELAARLVRNYMHAPYPHFIQRHSSEIIRTITGLVHDAYGLFLNSILTMAADAAAGISLVCASLFVAPGPALAAGLLTVTIHLVQHRTLRRIHRGLGAAHADIARRQLGALQQALDAFREARIAGREPYFLKQFDAVQQELRKNVERAEFFRRIPVAIGETAIVCSIALAVVVLLLSAEQINELMVALGLLAAIAFRLSPIGNRVVASAGAVHHCRPALELIAAELKAFTDLANPGNAPGVTRCFRSSIALHHVTYRYDGRERPALSDVSLTIRKGQLIGVIGPSGSGKSTLLDLLLGLLRPTSGSLLIDGEAADSGVRLNVGYVPQQVLLFDDALIRNVGFGLAGEEVVISQVEQALELAGLADAVRKLPQGIWTTIGEHGRLLSGGERQRVGIARALYRRPDLLVLDEPTSAMDAETETAFTEAMCSLRGTVTTVIISHRLATVRHCDCILMLNSGRLLDFGSFRELRSRNAHFRQMLAAAGDAPNLDGFKADTFAVPGNGQRQVAFNRP